MSDNLEFSEEAGLKALKKALILRVALVIPIYAMILCLPAGTLAYPEAWAYILTLFIPMILFGAYMFRRDPAFLARRMRLKEKRKEQKLIIKLSIFPLLASFILPGFDKRLGWSHVPVYMEASALLFVLAGYLLIIYVFLRNSYASRIVDVEQGQKVISSGPYALIRHPMCFGVIILYSFSPLALGSYWAVIPALLFIPVLVLRIRDEEKALMDKLQGYREYTKRTRYRLIPGIW